MAASDYTQLPEPDVRHMRPERGVQDNSTAQAITGFGEIALEANKMVRTNRLESDLDSLVQSQLDPLEDDLTPEDRAVVEKVGKQVDSLASKRGRGLSEDQFRIRAESLLKQHMAGAPALASELRARAGRVLGYDPTGSAIAVHYEQAQAQAAAAEAGQKAALAQGKSWGMNMLDAGSPEWFARYTALQQDRMTAQQAAQSDSINGRQLNAMSGTFLADAISSVNVETDRIFPNKVFDELTAQDITSMDEGTRQGAVSRLQKAKIDTLAAIRGAYTGATDAQVKSAVAGANAHFDFAIAKLDPSKDATKLQNRRDAMGAGLELQIQDDDTIRTASLMASMGLPIPAGLQMNVWSSVFGIVEGKDWTRGSGVSEEANKEAESQTANTVEKMLSGVDYSQIPSEDQPAVEQFVSNYTKVLGQESIKPRQQQAILESLTNPEVVKFISTLPKDSPSLVQIVQGSKDYARRTAVAASRKLEDDLDNFKYTDPSNFKDYTIKDNSDIRLVDGQIVISTNKMELKGKVAHMRKHYISRINTSIKAMSAATGLSMPEAAQALFERDSGLFSWIEGAQQPEQSGGAGQGPLIEPEGTLLQDEEGNKFRVVGGKYVREQ